MYAAKRAGRDRVLSFRDELVARDWVSRSGGRAHAGVAAAADRTVPSSRLRRELVRLRGAVPAQGRYHGGMSGARPDEELNAASTRRSSGRPSTSASRSTTTIRHGRGDSTARPPGSTRRSTASERRIEHIGSTAVPGLAASRSSISCWSSTTRTTRRRICRLSRRPATCCACASRTSTGTACCARGARTCTCTSIRRTPGDRPLPALRDRLRTSSADRELYAATKRRLAAQDWPTMNHYAEAKTEVIEAILARAAAQAGAEETGGSGGAPSTAPDEDDGTPALRRRGRAVDLSVEGSARPARRHAGVLPRPAGAGQVWPAAASCRRRAHAGSNTLNTEPSPRRSPPRRGRPRARRGV